MKSFKYYITSLLFAGCILTSCEDYLDPGYDEFLDRKEVFSSYIYSLQYVRNMYSYLPGGYHSVGGAMEAAMTDEAKHSDATSQIYIMNNATFDSRTYLESGLFGHYYSGIRTINIFFENVDEAIFVDANTFTHNPGLNDALRLELRGEALFLRAFYYFELLKRFGDPRINSGIPIVPDKSPTLNDNPDFARNSYDSCVNYIIANCDSAVKLLPVRRHDTDYGKASGAAALALKNRLLLYIASKLVNPSNDLERWKDAALAAKAVMDLKDSDGSKAHDLLPKDVVSKDKMYSVFSEPDNNEIIFSSPVAQNKDFEKNNFPPSFSGKGLTNPTQDLVDAFDMLVGYPISDERGKYSPERPYFRRDSRLGYFIGFNEGQIDGEYIYTYVDGKDGLNKEAGSTKTGYYIRKFEYEKTNIVDNNAQGGKHFWPHFRYAETLLNYAEAMTMAYGPFEIPQGFDLSAYDAIKKIRDRVGLVTNKAYFQSLSVDEFLEKVKNERRIELCFEGHRYWDVRRWMEGDKYFNKPIHGIRIIKQEDGSFDYTDIFEVEQRKWEDKMYALPIPYAEIQKSKLLKQNEGWN